MKPFHSRPEVGLGQDVVGPCDGFNNGPTNNSFSTQTQSSPSSFSHSRAAPSGVSYRESEQDPARDENHSKERKLQKSNSHFSIFFSSRGSFTRSSTGVNGSRNEPRITREQVLYLPSRYQTVQKHLTVQPGWSIFPQIPPSPCCF